MFDIKIPDITTELVYDIDMPEKEINKSIIRREIKLENSLGANVRVWKKLSETKALCIQRSSKKKIQYVFELENIQGRNTISSAINKWMFGKEEIQLEKHAGEDLRFHEKIYYKNPRLYEVRFNDDLFRLELRFAKLTEMGRDLLLEKKKTVKRNGKISTILREKGYLEKLMKFSYEKTLQSNREIAEKLLEEIVQFCVQTEIKPPKPVEPPFFFRTHEIKEIGDHLVKLCKQRGQETKDLLDPSSLESFLDDDFDEIVTKKERKEVRAKMKRKVRKIARQYWKKSN